MARRCSSRKAATPDQTQRIGDQTGGRVFLFLQTRREMEITNGRGAIGRMDGDPAA